LSSGYIATTTKIKETVATTTYITTTVLATTSLPTTATATRIDTYTNTTPTQVFSTTTEVYEFDLPTIVTSTSTEVIEVDQLKAIENPYGYPYTYQNGVTTYYISGVATSTNPTDTPCTLNLKTCYSFTHSIKGLQDKYEKHYAYNNTLTYTKYYPSQYYEYDDRGITTINIYLNNKIVGTYKYGTYTPNKQDLINNPNLSQNPQEITELTYLHQNYLGTPTITTDSTGKLTETIQRDSYGTLESNLFDNTKQTKTSTGFTGHKENDSLGITYAHARYLNNSNKQWLSVDPVSNEEFSTDRYLSDPQGQNSYSYVKNNPINLVDPDGKWWSEFARGEQSWSGDNGLQAEVGQAAQQMYDSSTFWNTTMNHQYAPAVISSAPLAIYGAGVAFGVGTLYTGLIGGSSNVALQATMNGITGSRSSVGEYGANFVGGAITGGVGAGVVGIISKLFSLKYSRWFHC
jgi:RHS repeat-associated protein